MMIFSSPFRGRRFIIVSALVGVSSLFQATGCEPRKEDAHAALDAAEAQRISQLVDEAAAELAPWVERKISALRENSQLEVRLSRDPGLLSIHPHNYDALQRIYAARLYAPIFVENGTLTAAGVAVSETMLSADDHGLDPADFHGPRIQEELAALRVYNEPARIHGAFELLPQDRDALTVWVQEFYATNDEFPTKNDLIDAIVHPVDNAPVPELSALIQARIQSTAPIADTAANLELLLADSFLRWGVTQRFSNLRYITTEMANARGWRIIVDDEVYSTRQPGSPFSEPMPDPSKLRDITDKEVALTLATEYFERTIKDENFSRALKEVVPPFEDYRRLVRAAKKYRAIALTGGWPTIETEQELRLGDQNADVALLKQRLAAEGYFRGDTSEETFDSELRAAVLKYQETHQLRATATISEETRTSLNVPAFERLAQIHVVQERWRHNRIGEDVDDQYIVVHVPDFHVELWDRGERVHRMRAVVGTTRYWRDEQGNIQVDGRTPLFSDVMQYVVFNPYWNVPFSLVPGYRKKIEENPNWLEENGFEFIPTQEGGELLRQLPGRQNALGLVKFLFPNEHDVYLHDTNERHLFNHVFRNYSHGCIRVDNALDFAALLISRDRNLSHRGGEDFVQKKLNDGLDQWISLKTPIPVHIEYFTVRVDDAGHTNFLGDFHRRDAGLVADREAWLLEHTQNAYAESLPTPGRRVAPPN